jgi:diketogulonate reductase-like aldo/keto reductase
LIKRRKFGWTGIEVPIIGQGTWLIDSSGSGSSSSSSGVSSSSSSIDRNHSPAYTKNPRGNNAIKAIETALDLGMTHIDTAEMYGNGMAEELVGQAIKGRNRKDLFLVSKVLPSHASYNGTIDACKRSLKRLNTDYLDVYLLHWPSSSHPISETMRAMEGLVSDGLVRFIGVSNFNVRELEAAQKSLRTERIACNQVLHHLEYRAIELNLIPYCIKQDIAVVGYSPFGHGEFPDPQTEKGKLLSIIGEKYGCTPRQVALNFLTTRHQNVFAIPMSTNPEHVKENANAVVVGGIDLKEEDAAAIDGAFPVQGDDNYLNMI